MSKQRKPDYRTINEDGWQNLKLVTYYNIKSLINAVRTLLDENDVINKEALFERPYVAAGLYTYVIEEYGKLLFLQSHKVENGQVIIDYSKFISHPNKFEIALKNLPSDCQLIHEGFMDSKLFGDNNQFDTETTADFEARKAIFYSDFDVNGVRFLPLIESETLKKALSKFEERIQDNETFNELEKLSRRS